MDWEDRLTSGRVCFSYLCFTAGSKFKYTGAHGVDAMAQKATASDGRIGQHNTRRGTHRTERGRLIDVIVCMDCGVTAAASDSGREDLYEMDCPANPDAPRESV